VSRNFASELAARFWPKCCQDDLRDDEMTPILRGDWLGKNNALFNFGRAFEECVLVSKTRGYVVWDESIRKAIKEHGTPAAKQF
jgi:hypothetical protein